MTSFENVNFEGLSKFEEIKTERSKNKLLYCVVLVPSIILFIIYIIFKIVTLNNKLEKLEEDLKKISKPEIPNIEILENSIKKINSFDNLIFKLNNSMEIIKEKMEINLDNLKGLILSNNKSINENSEKLSDLYKINDINEINLKMFKEEYKDNKELFNSNLMNLKKEVMQQNKMLNDNIEIIIEELKEQNKSIVEISNEGIDFLGNFIAEVTTEVENIRDYYIADYLNIGINKVNDSINKVKDDYNNSIESIYNNINQIKIENKNNKELIDDIINVINEKYKNISELLYDNINQIKEDCENQKISIYNNILEIKEENQNHWISIDNNFENIRIENENNKIQVENKIEELKNKIETEFDFKKIQRDIINKLYDGKTSIYLTVDSTPPDERLGGKWFNFYIDLISKSYPLNSNNISFLGEDELTPFPKYSLKIYYWIKIS